MFVSFDRPAPNEMTYFHETNRAEMSVRTPVSLQISANVTSELRGDDVKSAWPPHLEVVWCGSMVDALGTRGGLLPARDRWTLNALEWRRTRGVDQ